MQTTLLYSLPPPPPPTKHRVFAVEESLKIVERIGTGIRVGKIYVCITYKTYTMEN